jgi:hypothetical protein
MNTGEIQVESYSRGALRPTPTRMTKTTSHVLHHSVQHASVHTQLPHDSVRCTDHLVGGYIHQRHLTAATAELTASIVLDELRL